MNTIRIKDETAAGETLNELLLEFEQEYITVKDLIQQRVEVEIKLFAKNHSKNRLVIPGSLEQRVNKKKPLEIDVEKQLYIALDAFQKQTFIMLVDDEQVDDLNQKVWVHESTDVSFIKLTPLVGG